MIKKSLAIFLLTASSAFATGSHIPNPEPISTENQEQSQNQQQGQIQGQYQGINGSGNSYSSNNIDSNSHNHNTNRNDLSSNSYSDSKSGALSGSVSGAVSGSSLETNNDTNVDASNELNNTNGASNVTNVLYKRNPVSSAFAAALTVGDDVCMGSTSGGIQAVGFGASLGSTWRDSDCIRRKNARTLFALGQQGASIALLCQDRNIAKAMNDAGTPCKWANEKPEVISGGVFKGAVADYPGKERGDINTFGK